MTTKEIIQAIRRELAVAGKEPSASVAQAYLAACATAGRKLSQVAEMAGAGSPLQALDLAQARPTLWEELEMLGGAFRPDWLARCREHGLPEPGEFPAADLRTLSRLFSKDAQQTAAYYKQFRSAMMARDEDRAFLVLDAICALDPEDGNARQEKERIRRKRVATLLPELENAMRGDNEGEVLELLTKVERVAQPEELALSTSHTEAVKLRDRAHRAESAARVREMVGRFGDQAPVSGWLSVADQVSMLESECQRTKPDLPEETRLAFKSIVESVQSARREAARARQFEDALRALDMELAGADALLARRSKANPADLIQAKESLERVWAHVQAFALPLPDELSRRTKATVPALLRAVGAHQTTKRIRAASMAAAALVTISALGVFGFLTMRTRSDAASLESLMAGGQSATLEGVLPSMPVPPSWIPFASQWRSYRQKATEYLATHGAVRDEVSRRLAVLEARDGELTAETFLRNWAEAAAIKELAQKLPAEWKQTEDTKVEAAIGKLKLDAADLKARLLAEISEKFKTIDDALASARQEKLTPDELEARRSAAREAMDRLRVLLQGEGNPLLASAADAEKLETVAAKYERLQNDLAGLKESRAALRNARGWDEYWGALASLKANTSFPVSAEIAAAGSFLSIFPGTTAIEDAAVFPGNKPAMAMVREQLTPKFYPNGEMQKAEVDLFLDIRDNPNISDVRVMKIRPGPHGLPPVVYLSEYEEQPSGGVMVKIYDPKKPRIGPNLFRALEITPAVVDGNPKPSAESLGFDGSRFKVLLDEDGEKFDTSMFLPVSNVIRNAALFNEEDGPENRRGMHPFAASWLVFRMADIVRLRKAEWGCALVPEFEDDIKELEGIFNQAGRPAAEHWLNEAHAVRRDAERWAMLKNFFKEKEKRDYLGWGLMRFHAAKTILERRLRFCGHQPASGQPEFAEADKSDPLWGIGTSGTVVIAYIWTGAAGWEKVNPLMTLSPLFQPPASARTIREEAARRASTTTIPDPAGWPVILSGP
jgi:hypothetical protein